ncbi:hypothetical protein OG884_11880 [Streptosporangium sp. NBC_01755]|uniref:divisome protein SepX/GlpR n=1 Tax=unclassified Streptosporangium TaxID=2632669 RepID=UPI002DDB2346|nr:MULTISPECIES: hypothetical protein [unclassified Streptosporangium]WSA26014.1 hypothetical protein OIE13_34830 [Streptosporangium sp. NBC_01810]WSD02564.1 hypothetical protein OG884_11880 [Streptosporangium sp. NBC_01755]
MSSVVLYLAIVIMWLCVLVPMWLRRDRNTLVETTKDPESYAYDEDSAETLIEPPHASSPESPAESSPGVLSATETMPEFPPGDDAPPPVARETSTGAQTESETSPAQPPAGRPNPRRVAAERRRAELRRRGRQVAKRRRLTFWCVLLLLASVVTATVQVIPWWGVAPSVVLLGTYLAILRVTVQIDAEQRRAAAKARAERVRRARRRAALLEAQRPVAEVIDLTALRDELFDQYAETPRRAVGD